MPLYVRNKGGSFTPAPAGLHHSVCVDAVDLGMVDGTFGKKHMIALRWQTKDLMEDGKPYLVVKRYTASLHPKSSLRADLESWRSRKFTDDEANEFDLEKLLGANCQLVIVHAVRDGVTYGNVASIVPATGLPKLAARDYERVCARPGYVAPRVEEENHQPDTQDGPPPEDDIPF